MAQWVQSKYSKDATKWEVDEKSSNSQVLFAKCEADGSWYWLPAFEYVDCDPPTVWEVCTREVVTATGGVLQETNKDIIFKTVRQLKLMEPYCVAWSDIDPNALVIKRKVRP